MCSFYIPGIIRNRVIGEKKLSKKNKIEKTARKAVNIQLTSNKIKACPFKLPCREEHINYNNFTVAKISFENPIAH